MRVDVMVDIETLGTGAESTVFQIAAVAFNIRTGEQLDMFNLTADIEKNKKPLKVDGGTLKWWLNTNKELLTSLLNEGVYSSEDVLYKFYQWLYELTEDIRDVYLWGNGILFDNKIIQYQLEDIGLDYPIFYRNDRDLRTLLELASVKDEVPEEEIRARAEDPALVSHNAIDDVLKQINLAVYCYNILTGED